MMMRDLIRLLALLVSLPFMWLIARRDARRMKQHAREMREYELSLSPAHPDRYHLDEDIRHGRNPPE